MRISIWIALVPEILAIIGAAVCVYMLVRMRRALNRLIKERNLYRKMVNCPNHIGFMYSSKSCHTCGMHGVISMDEFNRTFVKPLNHYGKLKREGLIPDDD